MSKDPRAYLARLLGAVPRHEREGLHLDLTRPFWELNGKTTFPAFSLPLVLDGDLEEDKVRAFAKQLGMLYRRENPSGDRAAPMTA